MGGSEGDQIEKEEQGTTSIQGGRMTGMLISSV